MEFLHVPGQYSGDMWHVAGALLVRPSLKAVITIGSQGDVKGAPLMLKFFNDIGLGTRVSTLTVNGNRSTFIMEQGESGNEVLDIRELPGKLLMWQSAAAVQATQTSSHATHPLYRSTSMILHAMEEWGKPKVLEVLRAGLISELDSDVCRRIALLVNNLMLEFRHGKLLFVLGRIAGYNPQHDLTRERLQEIHAAAQQAGYAIMPVGWPGPSDGSQEGTVNHLVKAAQVEVHPCIDLRDWKMLTGQDVADERARAYFWRCVVDYASDNNIQVKLVGGRSGSTDLPAFMGMDVLCWDECDFWNPEYLRLLITAPILLEVTHTAQKHHGGPIEVVSDPSPQFGKDVKRFLEGRFVAPELRLTSSKNLTKKGGVLNKQMELLRAFERLCRIIFALPYNTLSSTGQHFAYSQDPSSSPLAFNSLNHLLRPYYSDPPENLDLLTDLRVFLKYVSLARQQGPHTRLNFASSMKIRKHIAPRSFDFYFT